MRKEVLLLLLVSGLIWINGCKKEHSLENGGPSQGSLQDDGTGSCLPKNVAGNYVIGTALNPSTNYIEVQVKVTKTGPYVISSDSLNGISFKASGVFSDTGYITVKLPGTGTPLAAITSDFTITYGTSFCSVSVATVQTLAVFTLKGSPDTCMSYIIGGTYTIGVPLTTSNTATINVNVTTPGSYSITTTVSNGMIFSASGTLATGDQTIILTAAGSTPTTAGIATVPVIVGSTSCNFKVNVGGVTTPATYTINCPASTVNGTYTVNTALIAANTISLSVDVATAGTYSITGTINNMTFSGSGTFASAGNGQSVTLTGTGTPNTAGANIVPLTGGTAPCNVTVTVNPPPAVFTVNCTTATVNGTYVQNTTLTPALNTVTLNVSVATAGAYNAIATTATNGMTFNAVAGTFASGAQTLTLTGSGTPNAAGTIFIPINIGTTPCSFMVLVQPPASSTDYFPRTTNSNWSYELNTVASDSDLIKVIAPTISALGNTYNIFMDDYGLGFDTSGFFRKTGNDYYRYTDLAAYLGVDNVQRVEFPILKDNMGVGSTWSASFLNAVQGTPVTIRIRLVVTAFNTTVPITTTMTGTINYPNTIVVEEHYDADVGTGFFNLDDQLGYFKDYYSKGIGWIKDEYVDTSGVITNTLVARRWIVY